MKGRIIEDNCPNLGSGGCGELKSRLFTTRFLFYFRNPKTLREKYKINSDSKLLAVSLLVCLL